jgi:hypothetical protein
MGETHERAASCAACDTHIEGALQSRGAELIVYAVAGRRQVQKRGLVQDITQAMVRNFDARLGWHISCVAWSRQSKTRRGVPAGHSFAS